LDAAGFLHEPIIPQALQSLVTKLRWGQSSTPIHSRIQKRKTNRLQIVKSDLQHTAGPYSRANNALMRCNKGNEYDAAN